MSSRRAIMALAALTAMGVDAAVAIRASREAAKTPSPAPKPQPESVVDWYRRREREHRERKRGRRV